MLLTVHVVTASVEDRDGAKRSLLWTRLGHPTVLKVWADQGFAGRLVDWAATTLKRSLEIVRKEPGQRGFQVQPKRWAVERTFAWLTARRRLARDYEHHTAHAETMIRWAVIGVIVRRLTRRGPGAFVANHGHVADDADGLDGPDATAPVGGTAARVEAVELALAEAVQQIADFRGRVEALESGGGGPGR
ncbi:transposase [Streptomyces sp. ME08-AFT2]|nr:transposase [Streptomyces sp. ME08-AFT2]MDX3313632.1 transposase [Streptomyces sp. ME08-AFT2]